MKKGINVSVGLLFAFFFLQVSVFAQSFSLKTDFSDSAANLKKIGRGTCTIADGVFKSKDAYACFGNVEWKNYVLQFKARAPQYADQVQIWAGFRAYNRNDRYIVGLRGGIQNTLYLSRMGYMGTDEFIGIRQLSFDPKPGVWYDVKIEVCGDRIRIFLNNEAIPLMDVEDKNANLAPSGEVTLGGSWIETEFDNLSITALKENHLQGIAKQEIEVKIDPVDKEKKRVVEREAYKPVTIAGLNSGRSEISLDGQWLFMPEHEFNGGKKASDVSVDDKNWHTMSVPNFWNPSRIWLHGESFEGHPKGVSDNYFQMETDRCTNYTFDYTKTKVAWYRHWIELPVDIKSKQLTLHFDAVSKVAEVYINGQLAGSHIGMFGDFSVDGTSLLKPGKNLVAVRVVRDFIKNIEDGEKIVDVAVTVPVTNNMLKDIAHGFYKDDPAGIWQPVKLVITDKVKIEDVFIKPTLQGASFDVTLKNYSTKPVTYDVSTDILEKATGNQLYAGVSIKQVVLNAGEERKVSFAISNLKPQLWTPNHPNLYDFTFKLLSGNSEVDSKVITSGFRTFEAKNGFFYLNGKQYWLRGANHTPFALAPNDKDLANSFYQIMKAGNIDITRTHTAPYNELWMDAADENGIGVSFEGTWPWLMISSSMPDMSLIDLWADEFIGLLKKYRNHPSLLFWTVNNEMKFYDNEPDFEVAKKKMKIISDVVKRMRAVDSTRPICFDSNYKRNKKKYGEAFFETIDDGDIDDDHKYINWYDYTVFKQFKGEFQKNARNEGRPLISQEMSTGYPNAETGHATRFYNLVHQNPQTLIGYQSYEYANPQAFLDVHSFITGELAEALRRSNDKASGILHFALLTWFRNVYDVKNIEPYPTYFAIKRALQPVLVSAEIWGRNLYAGEKLPAKICVVNDKENGTDLKETKLYWELVTETGERLARGTENVPAVKHSTRQWITPTIQIPEVLPTLKVAAKLKLKLTENGIPVSENEYKINIAQKSWSRSSVDQRKKIAVVDFNETSKALSFLKVNYTSYASIAQGIQSKSDILIVAGLDTAKNCSKQDLMDLRASIDGGAKVLVLNSPAVSMNLYPEYINGWIVPTEGDIVNMEIPESKVFDGIGLFDVRCFNNNKPEIPTVCEVAFKLKRDKNVIEIANQTKIHGYINGAMLARSDYVKTIKGFPIFRINKGGSALISGMRTEKATTDPIAGRLLVNMINELLNRDSK
ncbi:MAG: glycoside hydrolase family 2 [Bacteroidetes bacterium]|nr:glycoside hydrolase family 2 [Bacteroidota bacterium]